VNSARPSLAAGSGPGLPLRTHQIGRIRRSVKKWREQISVKPMKRHFTRNYAWLPVLFLFVRPGIAPSQQNPQAAPSHDEGFTIRTSVNLVVLRATVRDGNGAPVAGLEKEDFQVFENKVPQEIEFFSHEDVPVTVGLVIDNSGSMRTKRREVIESALAFARSSNPEDQVFVVNFNEHVSMGLPGNVPFTGDERQLEAALSRNKADGLTALYDGLAVALEQLKKGKWDKKVLIVISDGGDNASVHKLARIVSMVNQADAILYTLGIFDADDDDRNPRVLKQLSRISGGEAFFPGSLEAVLPICRQIAHDIRNQYTISYEPVNRNADGTYRAIEVKARKTAGHGRLTVSTRAGYSAPTNPSAASNSTSSRP
jgi:Ca-activated chloride channel family protein